MIAGTDRDKMTGHFMIDFSKWQASKLLIWMKWQESKWLIAEIDRTDNRNWQKWNDKASKWLIAEIDRDEMPCF